MTTEMLISIGQVAMLVAVFCFILAGMSILRIKKLARRGKGSLKGNPAQRQGDFNRFSTFAMVGGVVGGISLFISLAILILTQTQ